MSTILVLFDTEEAVFRRPFADRLLGGVLMAFFAGVVGFVFFPDSQGRIVDGGVFLQNLLVSVAVFLFFSFGAGPKDMTFDFQSRRWRSKSGYPVLAWNRSGDFAEISHLAVWSVRGYSVSVEWKNPNRLQTVFAHCATRDEAQALADRLGASLNVPVKAGVVRGLGKPIL